MLNDRDHDILMEIRADVKNLNKLMPALVKKVEKHDRIMMILVIIGVGIMAKFKGGWELIKAFFEG